jgi:hypothetical protein
MKTLKSISRKTILKAIKKEPLRAGEWVDKSDLKTVGNCHVCAVGAVLRTAGLPNNQIGNSAWNLMAGANPVTWGDDHMIAEEAAQIAKEGNHLAALSAYFEGIVRNYDIRTKDYGDVFAIPNRAMPVVRRKLRRFVLKNFPKRIRLHQPIAVPSKRDLAKMAAAYE